MKKLLTILLCCLLTAGMASAVSAAKWQFIRIIYDNPMHFDSDSFEKTGDTTYSVWLRLQLPEDQSKRLAGQKGPVSYLYTKAEFDYTRRTIKMLAGKKTDIKGKIISTETYDYNWEDIIPDTPNEAIFNVTCDYYKKNYQ